VEAGCFGVPGGWGTELAIKDILDEVMFALFFFIICSAIGQESLDYGIAEEAFAPWSDWDIHKDLLRFFLELVRIARCLVVWTLIQILVITKQDR
jgi:hypothetical protein